MVFMSIFHPLTPSSASVPNGPLRREWEKDSSQHPIHVVGRPLGLCLQRVGALASGWGLVLLFFSHSLFADKVLLKNSTFEEGKIEADNGEYVIISGKGDALKKIPRSEINDVIYDSKDARNTAAPGKPAQGTPGLTLFNLFTLRNFTGAVTVGWQNLSLSDLNSSLTNKGYQPAPENFFTLGGVAQVTISRVVLGLEGTWLWGAGREANIGGNTIKNSFSAFRGMGILGYLIYTSDRLDIFPYVGGGLAGYNLIMTNTYGDSFGNIISTGQRGAVLSSLSFLMTGGVQVTYRLPVLTTDKGVFGLALGAKGGYDIAFVQSNWAMGGINDLVAVSGGPKTPLTGPYAQAIIGIWFDFY
jgi:hypothetical protein